MTKGLIFISNDQFGTRKLRLTYFFLTQIVRQSEEGGNDREKIN